MQTPGKEIKSTASVSKAHTHSDLESRLAKLESIAHEKCDGGGGVDEERIAAIEKRIDEIAEKIMYKLGI
tara:strand:+ start:313 stop:522 length:210 start_codon:yes stop_codon:yes gene_type:complete